MAVQSEGPAVEAEARASGGYYRAAVMQIVDNTLKCGQASHMAPVNYNSLRYCLKQGCGAE